MFPTDTIVLYELRKYLLQIVYPMDATPLFVAQIFVFHITSNLKKNATNTIIASIYKLLALRIIFQGFIYICFLGLVLIPSIYPIFSFTKMWISSQETGFLLLF